METATDTASARFDDYDHVRVEAKWRRIWEERGDYRTPLDDPEHPFYNLMMFPYPSAEGLHVGHIIPYAGSDIYGRWRRLKGDTVFEPMGFDAFGIHSENYAMKIGEHPAVVMRRAVHNFRENQLKRIGSMFDWDHEVNTAEPNYYRWTQWVFLQLFKRGLAVQREGAVNWCPSCLTVLADEQVEQGKCERCHTVVETRYLRQWWLLITRYAQQLLDGLDALDWSDSTRTMQHNWIGRSQGALIRFDLEGCARDNVTVYTTRTDTLFGATFLVVGADHPELEDFVPRERLGEVNAWRNRLRPSDEPDFSVGIDAGSHAMHPLTGERIPVWIAPYVLGGYGTGVIMAVPANDERDWQFAKAHSLRIVAVISGGDVSADEAPHTREGTLINSDGFDGLSSAEGKQRIIARLQELGRGESSVQYKLRDWLISRQRYWGPPIPIIHCPVDGAVPVPEEDLPVLLPELEDFRPTGTGVSPLATVEDWVNVSCPQCGGPARRETDVSDTFLDSAWYFLRYPSTDFDDVAWDEERTATWLPVDMYIGGNEHAVRHLLYSRFLMRVFHEMGLVPVPEPFTRFRAHGIITRDGRKMSKTYGNVVNPDEYIERYGADTFRLYMMYLGPYMSGGDFRDAGIAGMVRFLHRVWRLAQTATSRDTHDAARERRRHRLIKRVDDDIAELGYNTAIAFLMEFARDVDQEAQRGEGRRVDAETLLLLLAPFAPFITEELWQRMGSDGSVHAPGGWPQYDPDLARVQRVTVAITVNGKVRDQLEVDAGTDQDQLRRLALQLPRIRELLEGREPSKVVAVVDRIVNIVV
ncbi:MAG: leucine--tRNA ligase [Candidatus Dormibacteraeota bacterium]|nr:leucine--tRNA ligase [Candidatus Dormibacteraeota bacterium]